MTEQMTEQMTEERLREIEARAAAATPGPWRSKRDGNQYVRMRDMDSAKLVGASRIEEVPRPWHRYSQDGRLHELSRFLDADGDFIAAAREDVPALVNEVRRLLAENERLRKALESVWAAIGDRLHAKRPLALGYAQKVMAEVTAALAGRGVSARSDPVKAQLFWALRDLLQVIAADDLLPESISYMWAARLAIAAAEAEKQGGGK